MGNPNTTGAYKWPAYNPDDPGKWPSGAPEPPAWVDKALEDGRIRVSDDLAYVRGPDGDLDLKAGDFLIRAANGTLLIANAELFSALTGQPDVHSARIAAPVQPNPEEAHTRVDDPMPVQGEPPYTSAVLARSAMARAKQAEWEKSRGRPHPDQTDLDVKGDPHNAAHEGDNRF